MPRICPLSSLQTLYPPPHTHSGTHGPGDGSAPGMPPPCLQLLPAQLGPPAHLSGPQGPGHQLPRAPSPSLMTRALPSPGGPLSAASVGPRDTLPNRCSHNCREAAQPWPLVHPPLQNAGVGECAFTWGRAVAREELAQRCPSEWPVPGPRPTGLPPRMLPVPAWKGPGQSHPFEGSIQLLPRGESPESVPARPSLVHSFIQQALTVCAVCVGGGLDGRGPGSQGASSVGEDR